MTWTATRLFSYCLPADTGAAPNPYGGVCSLVIAKPRIRLIARVGDWIVGTGSKSALTTDGSTRDLSGRVVFAMLVTEKMTMQEYDGYTQAHLRDKLPDPASPEHWRRAGDSIYDFANGAPVQRRGAHRIDDMKRDLSGGYALLSSHFYYFGAAAIELPEALREVAQNFRGHRVNLNEPFVQPFAEWIDGLGHAPHAVLGEPLMKSAEDVSMPRRHSAAG